MKLDTALTLQPHARRPILMHGTEVAKWLVCSARLYSHKPLQAFAIYVPYLHDGMSKETLLDPAKVSARIFEYISYEDWEPYPAVSSVSPATQYIVVFSKR